MAKSLVDQIMELEAQKQALMTQAKDETLATAQKAVADLNNLGFHYTLVEGSVPRPTRAPSTPSSSTTRPRRGGVREEVLGLISSSSTGLNRSAILEQLHAKGDTKAEQSISNALSNLKKAGDITAEDGIYQAKA